MTTTNDRPAEIDLFAARVARRAPGLLAEFNLAGVLDAADVHVALRLGELGGEMREEVLLAAALAVRAPRLGHVYVDLADVHATAAVESEETAAIADLPWPAAAEWVERVGSSALTAAADQTGAVVMAGGDVPEARPLRLAGSHLYLDRYLAEEVQVAHDLLAMAGEAAAEVEEAQLAADVERLFAGVEGAVEVGVDGGAGVGVDGTADEGVDGVVDEAQRRACQIAVRRRLSVIAGGPGTGKTTTVARVAALLVAQAVGRGRRPPLIALAAPTGKAAARLEEAVHEAAAALPFPEPVREALLGLRASTLHRLLGRRPNTSSRFRHHHGQRLAHDVVIVDETSMVSLSLMARLTEALRPQARLVLVGDPAQLASIEAGAVLGDIVGPAIERALEAAPASSPLASDIVVLDRGYRFGGAIARLAGAVRAGDADAVIAILQRHDPEVQWLPVQIGADDSAATLEPVRRLAVAASVEVIAAARDGRAHDALDALRGFRLLCGHRRGPQGVTGWAARVQAWLGPTLGPGANDGAWYPGRPLLITENDYELGLLNGDTGVVVTRTDGGIAAAFSRRGEIVLHIPTRLSAFQTLHAMTIHKSQGSQFRRAAVLLPEPDSRILTRELLYTAVTRARDRLLLAGSEETIRAAVHRPVGRASGLADRLWPVAGAARPQ